jgi:hypothetical protein
MAMFPRRYNPQEIDHFIACPKGGFGSAQTGYEVLTRDRPTFR